MTPNNFTTVPNHKKNHERKQKLTKVILTLPRVKLNTIMLNYTKLEDEIEREKEQLTCLVEGKWMKKVDSRGG